MKSLHLLQLQVSVRFSCSCLGLASGKKFDIVDNLHSFSVERTVPQSLRHQFHLPHKLKLWALGNIVSIYWGNFCRLWNFPSHPTWRLKANPILNFAFISWELLCLLLCLRLSLQRKWQMESFLTHRWNRRSWINEHHGLRYCWVNRGPTLFRKRGCGANNPSQHCGDSPIICAVLCINILQSWKLQILNLDFFMLIEKKWVLLWASMVYSIIMM